MSNLSEKIFDLAKTNPNQVALVLHDAPIIRKISYLDLVNRVKRCARYFQKSGLSAGDAVALQVADPLLDLICFLALSAIGVGVYVPPRKTEIEERIISLLDIKTCVCLAGQNDFKLNVITVEGDFSIENEHSGICDDFRICNNESCTWLIRSSSGTTGFPKIFATTHRDAALRQRRYYDAAPIGVDDLFFSFTPIRFGAARQRVFYALAAGASVVIAPEANLTLMADRIITAGVTHIYCVPMHLEMLCDYSANVDPERKNLPVFSMIKSIETSSSTVSPSLRERVLTHLSPNLFISYSVSEIGHISSTRKSLVAEDQLNNIGMPVSGIDIRIFDDGMKELDHGISGLIAVRLKDVTTKVTCLTKDKGWISVEKDGWFFPGDIGYLSSNGNLIFQGRNDDMLIFNGINIFPAEIEWAIRSHSLVKDVVVFSIPSRVNNQIPCAALILSKDVHAVDLLQYFRQKLGARSPQLVFRVQDFPRNGMGKVLVSELRRMAIAQLNKRKHSEH